MNARLQALKDPGPLPTIWFEVEDLLRYFDRMAQPSGIQRVSLELMQAAVRSGGANIRFCRLSATSQTFEAVDLAAVRKACAVADRTPRAGPFGLWRELRKALHYCATYHQAKLRDRAVGVRRAQEFARLVSAGDVMLCLGSPWANVNYANTIGAAKRRYGIKFALLVHDVIAMTEPELFTAKHVTEFGAWLQGMIAVSDLLFVSSEYSRKALQNLGRQRNWAMPEVEIIRFGAGFGVRHRANAGPSKPSPFVLFVATLEIRKNHRLLVRLWERLIERHGSPKIPTLVFVGHVGWMIEDFLAELRAKRYLDGKILVRTDVSDAALADAYRACLFTVYPSLCEGWGLPISESLLHGKFCVASNRTSLPEVGGDLVDYFDPADENEALAKIERVLFEPGYLAARAARIAAEYDPPTWNDCARNLIASLDALTLGSARLQDARVSG